MRMAFYAAQRNDELAYGPYPCPDSIPSSSDACRISLWLEGLPRTLPEVLVLHASTPSPAYGPYPCSDSILLLLRLLEAALGWKAKQTYWQCSVAHSVVLRGVTS